MNAEHESTTVHVTFRETQALLREIAQVDPDRAALLFREWIDVLDESPCEAELFSGGDGRG